MILPHESGASSRSRRSFYFANVRCAPGLIGLSTGGLAPSHTCSVRFDLLAQLGLDRTTRIPWRDQPDPLDVASAEATIAGLRFGSCHVLELGRHMDEYWSGAPLIQPLPAGDPLPLRLPYQRQVLKQRGGSVTGNLGEMLTWLIANRRFGLAAEQVAHVRPTAGGLATRTPCPDFLLHAHATPFDALARALRVGGRLAPSRVADLDAAARDVPAWWPVEAKSRDENAGAMAALREGFRQLAAYWWHTVQDPSAGPGYGLIVATVYSAGRRGGLRRNPSVITALFAPRDPAQMVATLRGVRGPRTWGGPRAAALRTILEACL